MSEKTVTIISAFPGFSLVYAEGEELFTDGEPVIAWRIEVQEGPHGPITTPYPITPEGDPSSNWMATMYPDGSVRMHDSSHENLEAAQKYFANSMRRSEPT